MTSTDDLGRLRTKLAPILGWSLSAIGIITLVIGVTRFRTVDRLF